MPGTATIPPAEIARVALRAIRKGVHEVDTDFLAIDVRAHLARDPMGLEHQMQRALHSNRVSTGR